MAQVAQDSGPTSVAAIIATLIPTSITAFIFLAIFVAIRFRYRKIYVPRTFMGTIPPKDRTPSSNQRGSNWFHDFRSLPDKFVLQHQSLDGYLFLRFFRLIILICFIGSCTTWPILFPVNATGGGAASKLDKLTFGNVEHNDRLYAHAVVAWLFLGLVILLITREQLFLVGARQAYLSSHTNTSRLSSRVVLFLFAPLDALKTDKIQDVFGSEAQKSWVVSDQTKLENLVSERNDKAKILEAAEVQLSMEANKKRLEGEQSRATGNRTSEHAHAPSVKVPYQSRPKHKLTPVVGTKVDTVEWAREALPRLQNQVHRHREASKTPTKQESLAVFVAYSSPAAARRAYREVTFHPVVSRFTSDRLIGVQPKEVLWTNLTLGPSSRMLRTLLATAVVIATILFWAIPIGIVGVISNIQSLADEVKFLGLLKTLPPGIIALISGILPPIAVSTLVSYVPKIFRYIAKLTGAPTIPQAELRTQTWYFIFQVIQVFLVTTFSAGAAAVAMKIAQDPSGAPIVLARHLPQASNFYLTYILFQGTASASKNVLNYSDLFEYLIYDRFFDKTPRDKYNRFTSMKNLSLGSVYPKFTNLAVIAVAYSCIAPLILGFAAVGLYLFYLSYRYNLLYAIQTKIDTKGEAHGRALQHTFTGVYLAELCLIGLFGARQAPGPSTMMIILLIATILYHIILNHILTSVEETPVVREGETAPLLAAEEGNAEDSTYHASKPGPAGIIGLSRLPPFLSEPIAEAVESYIASSQETVSSWLNDPSTREDDHEVHYTEEEMRTAYLHPALTSKTPQLWLPHDETGVSQQEIEENEAVGISTTAEGAFLDSQNRVRWTQDDFGKIPIFKRPVEY